MDYYLTTVCHVVTILCVTAGLQGSCVNTRARGWFIDERVRRRQYEWSGEKKKEGSNLEHTRGHKARSMPEESQSYRFLKNKWTDISLWSLPLITIGKRVQGGGMSVGCGRWMTGNHWAPGRNLQSLHKSRLVWAQWPQKSLWSAASQRV